MCTQNIPAFAQSSLLSTPALFLNPRGRILFDTLLTKIPNFESQSPAFYIDIHTKQANDFLSHLDKYKLKRDIALHDISDLMEIYALFSENSCPEGEPGTSQKFQEAEDENVPQEMEKAQGYVSFIDPRTEFMGTRTICVGDALELDDQEDVVIGTQDHYDLHRCIQGIPEGPSTTGHIPHFLNYHHTHAISDSKGCYIGQELIARASANLQSQEEKRAMLPCCVLHEELLDAKGRLNSMSIKGFLGLKTKDRTGIKVLDVLGKEAGKVIFSVQDVGLVTLNTTDIKDQEYRLETGEKVAFWKPMWLERKFNR